MRHNKQSADDNLVLQLDDLNRPHHVRNLAQVSHDVPTQLTGFTGGRHMSHSSHEDRAARGRTGPKSKHRKDPQNKINLTLTPILGFDTMLLTFNSKTDHVLSKPNSQRGRQINMPCY